MTNYTKPIWSTAEKKVCDSSYENWFISLSHPERQETKKTELNIYIILWNFMIFHEVAKLIDNTVHTKDMSKSMRLVVWSDLVIGVSIPLLWLLFRVFL